MRARIAMALFALALTAVGCGSATPPPLVSVAPIDARPAGAQEVTTAPEAAISIEYPIQRMASVSWTSPQTNRLLLEARAGFLTPIDPRVP